MAAGRGEFFQSFLEGLERKPALPVLGTRPPGGGRGKPGPCRARTGVRRREKPLREAPRSVCGKGHSCQKKAAEVPEVKTPPSRENFIEKLPSEILIRILSYLDATSLFCISHVSKLFFQLSNDDVMWHKIYMSECGSQTWRPKLADEAAVSVDPVEVEDQSASHWKRLYFKTKAGQGLNKWKKELRDISPYTGLPRQTERVLRNMNVSWELTLRDRSGWERTLEQSRVFFHESSVIVHWSGGSFPRYSQISKIQLYGVRKETLTSPKVTKPGWRSLMLKLDMKTQHGRYIGRDSLVRLMHLKPGFIVGIWRGQSSIAFIMVSLHFHKLVEKSLLGSPVCPYSEPADLPLVDNSDPEFGLHGYALNFVLHNTGTKIMSGHFGQLSCHKAQIQQGLVELRVITDTDLSRHRLLSGNIKLPWKVEALEGSVENCCIISMTLLDEFQKPFWCVSSPVCISAVRETLPVDYSGEQFRMKYQSSEGQVQMKLVWLKEQKQFFLTSLTLYISVYKVNKHFRTRY